MKGLTICIFCVFAVLLCDKGWSKTFDTKSSNDASIQSDFRKPFSGNTGLGINAATTETKFVCHPVTDNLKDNPELQQMLGLSPQQNTTQSVQQDGGQGVSSGPSK